MYSNIFQAQSGGSGSGGIAFDSNYSGMNAHIYDNTIVEYAGSFALLLNITGSGSFSLSNNIIYNTDAGGVVTGITFASRDHNLWFGPNIPSCSGFPTDICGRDPLFTNYAGNDFSLKSGSPAIGLGANLGTSFNQYPLPGATWPNPQLGTRPGSGAWDTGAYSFGASASQPAPPSGLTAIVN
jgi:hypothetical protein